MADEPGQGAAWQRTLSAAEFAAWIDAPFSDEERDEMQSQIRWFCRRYPTPGERIAHVRRRVRQITRRGEISPADKK